MIKIRLRGLAALILATPALLHAGTVFGTLQTPNGLPIKNGTLNFTLAQAGLAFGTGAVVPSTVACYTSIDGNVVGLPNPLAMPQGSVNASAGTLPAGTYYVQETLYNGTGESLPSPELTIAVPSGGTLTLSPPANFPATATGMRVYVASTSGSETLQGSVTSGNFSLAVPLVAGAARPSANSSSCQISFNDTIVPFTGYKVSLLSSAGQAYPGWPQQWQLNGGTSGTVNVSQGAPLWDGTVIYPTPILSSPLHHGQQSISGPLDFGGYNVSGVGNFGAQNGTFSGSLLSAIDNGVINPMAAKYTGADLSARIQNAIATDCTTSVDVPYGPYGPGCTIKVPPALYVTTGEIWIPSTGSDISIDLTGVTIQPAAGVVYGIEFAPGTNHFFLHGGLIDFINDEDDCKAGLVFGRGIQGGYVDSFRETRCHNGDGLLNLGTNVATVMNSSFVSNLIGVHLLGSPGYASNNNKFIGNIITGNRRQGIIDGDRSQYPIGWPAGNGSTFTTAGTSSPNYNNLFWGNDLELNGGDSTSATGAYGAVLISLTVGDMVEGNYFEATPYVQITLGDLGYADSAYQFMYGVTGPNGGTAVKTNVLNNYITTSGGHDIDVYAAALPIVTGNADAADVANDCFINITEAATGSFVNSNEYFATSEFCQGGAAQTAAQTPFGPDTFDLNIATAGNTLFFNHTNGDSTTTAPFIKFSKGGPPAPTNVNNYNANKFCSPAWPAGSQWTDTCQVGDPSPCTTGGGVLWLCVDDTQLATPSSDGNRTWVKK